VKLTQIFSLDELACHDDTPVPAEWVESRAVPLAETAQAIRDYIGRPLSVISGYRTPAWIERVGGAKGSQHVQAKALDLRAGNMTAADLHAAVLELYEAGKLPRLGGLGLYRTFVHIDIRDRKADGSIARWSGKGVE
jgi:uncharacterized protein YcbK (DUF882 family)